MTTPDLKSVRLGDEYDQPLRELLIAVLRTMGGVIDQTSFGVAGSQALERIWVTVTSNGRVDRIAIESETYVGLTIAGRAELVDSIRDAVHARTLPG